MKIKKRFFKVLVLFLRIFLSFWKEIKISQKKGYKYAEQKMLKRHTKDANALYDLAVNFGGVMIKLCQYFSTRRDIFPDPYIKILSGLQDAVPPVSFDAIFSVIKAEYGDKINEFETIDQTSIASASLGQVHKARLKNGKNLILKILKPNVEKDIDTDFAILYLAFKAISKLKVFKQNNEFVEILEEFIRVTGDELNFEREAYIADRFRKGMSEFSYIKIPEIYHEFTTRKILAMEYVEGDKITNSEIWEQRNNDPVVISRRLIEIYFHQFLTMKLIHFDPHPGNLLVTKNNNIVILDFGMSGEISKEMRDGMLNIIRSFTSKNYDKTLKTMEKLGFLKKDSDYGKLIPIMEYFFEEIVDKINLEKESMLSINLSPVIDEIIDVVYEQPFRLPYEWAYIGRTLGTLTGIISHLYPNIKLFEELKPHFNRVVKENFSEIIEEVKNTAKDFLKQLFVLPERANTFITKVEQGRMNFEIDPNEIDQRVDVFQTMLTKSVGVALSLFSAFFSYYFLIRDEFPATIIFGSLSLIFLGVFLFYKKRNSKDMIKKRLKKK